MTNVKTEWKTTLARQIVKNCIGRGVPSYVHSGEMSKESWLDVTACLIADLSAWKIRKPRQMNLANREQLRWGLCASMDPHTAYSTARTDGTKEQEPVNATCNAKTTAGKRCRAAAVKDGLCTLHADPKRAAEMGRKSGQARRSKDLLAQERAELSPPRTAQEVRVALGEFISDVRSRRLDPKVAGTLGYLANVLLKSRPDSRGPRLVDREVAAPCVSVRHDQPGHRA